MAMAAATAATAAVTGRRGAAAAGVGGSEGGKFLGQLLRAAVRARGPLPIAGTNEDFAVALAFPAMKFVNRHEGRITGIAGIFKRRRCERK